MSGWESKKLGRVCSFINRGISPVYVDSGGVRVLNQKCVRDHGVLYEAARRHDASAKQVSEERFVRVGDVLVNSTGTGTLGRVAQAREALSEPTTVDSHVTIVRPMPGLFYPPFFGYMLEAVEDQIKGAGEGCGGQTELSRSTLAEKFEVRFPKSVAEQQRIVGILDEAFEGVAAARANAERNSRNSRALFQSETESIFTRGSVCWDSIRLGDITEVQSGGTPRISERRYWGGDVPWYSSGELNYLTTVDPERHITREGLNSSNAKLFPAGSLLVGMYDTAALKMSILDRTAAFNQAVAGVKPASGIDLEFVLYAINARRSELLGQRRGVRQKNLSLGKIKEITLGMPEFEEQRAVVVRLRAAAAESERLGLIYDQKLTALDELKRALLHQAFTGQLTASRPMLVAAPGKPLAISTTDLHAGVIALAYRLHEQRPPDASKRVFGHVKAEKIAHMVEAHLGVDLGRVPVKDAAGPNDFPRLKRVEHRARKAGYFDFRPVGSSRYRFTPRARMDGLIERTRTNLGERWREVEPLVRRMAGMSTRQAEIVATVYAAWNNLLLDGEPVTDERIVYEARENWHPDKLNIPRERFFAAIEWMRRQGLIPSGTGKRVSAKHA